MKFVLPKKALIKLYYAIVHPHLLYGVVAWESNLTTYINKLITLPSKTVKTVGGGKYQKNNTSYYFKLNILVLPESYKFEIAKMNYSFTHNNLPSSYPQLLHQNLQCLEAKYKVNLQQYKLHSVTESINYSAA